MNRLSLQFGALLGVLAGGTAAVFAVLLTGSWLFPALFGALPPWLPEDLLWGLVWKLLDQVLAWFPALAVAALALSLSFLATGDSATAPVRTSVVAGLALVVCVAFAVIELLAQPWIQSNLETLAFRSNQTRQLEDAYLRLKAKGVEAQRATDLDARLNLLKRLGLLRPLQGQTAGEGERFDYDFELQILKAHFELDDFFRQRALPGVLAAADQGGATVEDLLTRSEAALADVKSDQEYLANLWAYQAYRRLINAADRGQRIDARLRDRAKAAIDQSWARIYEKTLAADERKKASYFFRKGKSLGDFQFQNYLEAFYGFQELHEENPRDQEVTQHWELSRQKADASTLFTEEMDVLFQVPGLRNLAFINREVPLEVVRIGQLLDTSNGVYFKDFEFLRLSPQGQVLLHWTAPYGRWDDDGLDFRVWDRAHPVARFPTVLAETAGNEYNPQAEVSPPRFQPRVRVHDLELVNADGPRPQTLGTLDLLLQAKAITTLGSNPILLQTEFLVRGAAPLALFLVLLLVAALAWPYRAHSETRAWWLLLPVLPWLADFTLQALSWGGKLVVGGLLQGQTWDLVALELTGLLVAALAGAVIAAHRSFARS